MLLDSLRRWGYLQADLDWLGRLQPAPHPELDVEDAESERLRAWYCGTLAAEFMHIPDPKRRQWIQQRIETSPHGVDRAAMLELLMRASLFEQVLQTRYIGSKRFSLEGNEALIPLLAELLHQAAEDQVELAMLGMSHRGRLNVMAHIVGVDLGDLFAGFEDVDPRTIMGAGDVKYHLGATGTFTARNGQPVAIHLASNPSHLEAVNPVLMGRVRAKQDRWGDGNRHRVLPILMHGDAAMAGQGVTAETLNLADIDGFSVGGTIHVVVNNLIGFTAQPPALHSSRFASDIAKRLPIPIFHVNGEDPDAVVRAARLAAEYRRTFRNDVVVDLIGFRRHGHSEIDDPSVTQPLLYGTIKDRPPLWQSYAERTAQIESTDQMQAEIRAGLDAAKGEAEELEEIPRLATHPYYWSDFEGGAWRPDLEVDTGLPVDQLGELTAGLTQLPQGFTPHPKLARLLEQRAAMGRGERPLDFGMAEQLALASLVTAGHPARFSGQDTRRGTFNQRHSVVVDHVTGGEYCPLQHLSDDQATFETYDSALSEAAGLGFEYGYSRDYPETLVAWEAQFGDFVNGAQIILDQFVTAGEDKWGLLSGLVVLLPHGFEGQGPEHSSARMERFLQLAAEDAIQVAQPSTAAQYFHLLRRQALRAWRKPLIVFTPKSMLRNPAAASELAELGQPRFRTVLTDQQDLADSERLLFCTGKIAHELRAERAKLKKSAVAVVTLEQIYPFPEAEILSLLGAADHVRDIVWVQEEPANMGALAFIQPRLGRLIGNRHLRSIKRSESASPATGSAKAHQMEQRTILALAFG